MTDYFAIPLLDEQLVEEEKSMNKILDRLPATDDEVNEFFDSYSDKIRASAVKGLYKVLRMQDKDLLTAYKETLLAVVGETQNLESV